jgi:hypothetical protein
LLVTAEAALLKAPDANHIAVEGDEFVVAELGVDGGLAGIIASDFGLFGGGGFLGHRENGFSSKQLCGRENPFLAGAG